MTRRPWFLSLLALPLLLLSCSSAPTVSEGTQHFLDAQASFKSSDYKAALRNLDKTIKSADDEATRQQAVILRTLLVAALANANKQMAEAYSIGAKQPPAQSHTAPFYQARSDYFNTAHSYLMDAMQAVMDQRSKLGAAPMPIQITFPGFTGSIPGLIKLKTGILLSDADRANAELQADRNSLAAILSAIAGAPQDPNKGQEIYAGGKVDIDPRFYIVELSNSFLQIATIYDYRGLNTPDRFRTVNEVVRGNLEVAQKLLTVKPDKELEARVKKMTADCDKCLKLALK